MKSSGKRLYLQLCCLLLVNLVYGSREFQRRVLQYIGYTCNYCFRRASLQLIAFRKLSVQTVDELWDFMEHISCGQLIAQTRSACFFYFNDFQKMYVDCLASTSHEVGKRHVASKRSILYVDRKPYKIEGPLRATLITSRLLQCLLCGALFEDHPELQLIQNAVSQAVMGVLLGAHVESGNQEACKYNNNNNNNNNNDSLNWKHKAGSIL